MDIAEIVQTKTGYLISLLRWLTGKIFSDKKLDSAILITPVPMMGAINADCLGTNVGIRIRVHNFSPFSFKITHCVLRFYCAGFSIQMTPDSPCTVPAFSYEDIYAKNNITAEQGKLLAKSQIGYSNPRIEYHFSFLNKLTSFNKSGNMDGLPFEKTNGHIE